MQTGKKILIVDDEPGMIELMQLSLEENGYKVLAATVGMDARFKLQNEEFDLIITDLQMPKMSGDKLIQEVQINNDTSKIPILVITGNLDAYQTKISKLKNITILQKPFELEALLSNVDTLIDPQKSLDNDKSKKFVKKDELLINADTEAIEMYWVINGSFRAYKVEDGTEIDLGVIGAEELVGEMSFIDSQKRSVNVIALENSEVLIIPPSKFTKVIEAQPKWFKNLVKNLSLRLRETNKKVHSDK